MPLACTSEAFVVSADGVHFPLQDGERYVLVRCAVTRGALAELAGRPLRISEQQQVFHAHRAEIERIASRKYDARQKKAGMITVAPADFD